jgi:hypothetical protein
VDAAISVAAHAVMIVSVAPRAFGDRHQEPAAPEPVEEDTGEKK